MRVLATDPGFDRIGFASLEKQSDGRMQLLFSECFETDRSLSFPERLFLVAARFNEHITTHHPDCVAIEKVFFSKNRKTAMLVAEVRGALTYLTLKHKLTIAEYEPSVVKNSVTGNGSASKDAVFQMIRRLVRIDEKERYDDEYDAVAIGITHLLASRKPIQHLT